MDYWKALGFDNVPHHSSEQFFDQLFAEHANSSQPYLVPFEGCTIQKGALGWFAVIDSPPQLLLIDGIEAGRIQAWSCLGENAPLFPIEITTSYQESLFHGPTYLSVWGYLSGYRSIPSVDAEPGTMPTSEGHLEIVGCILENSVKMNVLTSKTVHQSTLWIPGLTIPVVLCQEAPAPGTFIEGALELITPLTGDKK